MPEIRNEKSKACRWMRRKMKMLQLIWEEKLGSDGIWERRGSGVDEVGGKFGNEVTKLTEDVADLGGRDWGRILERDLIYDHEKKSQSWEDWKKKTELMLWVVFTNTDSIGSRWGCRRTDFDRVVDSVSQSSWLRGLIKRYYVGILKLGFCGGD